MDPLSAAASFVTGLIRTHKLNEWAKLVFSMGFSFVVSFSYACGTALSTGSPAPVAVGAGLILGASAMTVLYVRSPLTKGMTVVQPVSLPSADPNLVSVEKK